MSRSKNTLADDGGAFLKKMGGTGKHIDGDVSEPLAERPFQVMAAAMLMLPDI
jgi:hypothetical protein